MIDAYVESFFEEFIITIAALAGGTVFAYFRSIRNKQIANVKTLENLTTRAWRIEKALTMLAKLTAMQTKQAHPELDTSNLEEVVKDMMDDKL